MRIPETIKLVLFSLVFAFGAAVPASAAADDEVPEGDTAEDEVSEDEVSEDERLTCGEQLERVADFEHEVCVQRNFRKLRAETPWVYTAYREELAADIHEEEAHNVANNNRHVVLAYAALWAVVMLFVLYMWIRQRRLQEEIDRLEREVARAREED